MPSDAMFKTYAARISSLLTRGDAREESYYGELKDLLLACAAAQKHTGIDITILPKKTEAGNPDFRVWKGENHEVGYIEAKDPSIQNLDTVAQSEQLKRYLSTFPNLILTNFYEFRLYRDGVQIDAVTIGRPFIATKLKRTPPLENEDKLSALIDNYLSFALPHIRTAEALARELAKRTRFFRDQVITRELEEETPSAGENSIKGFYDAFKQYLIADLSRDDFADLYAQTVTYGLFAARTRATGPFTRRTAFDYIPKTIGILRDLFRFISMEDLPPQLSCTVDGIAGVLAVSDAQAILHRYFVEGKGKDPVVHFYETFLSVYNPSAREQRGVYYTPEPVVSFITRSLHHLLKKEFSKSDGLADPSVTVLDPAAGTLTFLADAAALAAHEYTKKYGAAGTAEFVRKHILEHFFAFELMMAPYAIGHIKMAFLLEELGCRLKDTDRVKLYLTNTLEMEELPATQLPGVARALSEESHLAAQVKREQPILVVLGNPPYSGHSTNTGEWISAAIKDYLAINGVPLGERNTKWLQDDYVKFIRFAQWKIDQAGEGVVGFITNHGYLDNPTFRGMRWSLMQSFTDLYVLDLHGNALKKETCPDGSKDENVFQIMQGVAIVLMVKRAGATGCTVRHAEVWGEREDKFAWLLKNDWSSLDWKELTPRPEAYLFVPRDERRAGKYEKFTKVTDIFPINSVGIVTARDGFTVAMDRSELERRFAMFVDTKLSSDMIAQAFSIKDGSKWTIEKARQELRKEKNWREYIMPVQYRPFDCQWLFYHDAVIERSRREVMQHMMQDNLALIMPKRVETAGIPWTHVLCSDKMIEHVTISAKTTDYLLPLYSYSESDPDKKDLFSTGENEARQPNIPSAIFAALQTAYGKAVSPEDIFHYIYAVLYAPEYRTRYAEFLKTDFPRVPFTADKKLFHALADVGEELVALHLLKSAALETPAVTCPQTGTNEVEKPSHDEKQKRLYFNKTQYFAPVSAAVWEYQIGGYQVCEKWLKDRKGRCLSAEDIRHACRFITAIEHTIPLQKKLDTLYSAIEKSILPIVVK